MVLALGQLLGYEPSEARPHPTEHRKRHARHGALSRSTQGRGLASLFHLSTPGSSSVIDATVPAMSPRFIPDGGYLRKVTGEFAPSAAQVASNGFASRVAGIRPCISSCDLHRLSRIGIAFSVFSVLNNGHQNGHQRCSLM
jgi:hypothetical protein